MRDRLIVLALLSLAGCSQATANKPSGPAAESRSKSTDQGAHPAVATALTAPMLSYTYTFSLEAAPDRLQDLYGKHQSQCLAAGPMVCQVTSSHITTDRAGGASGHLGLRATQAWITKFDARLATDAKAAGGRLKSADTGSEDLTRAITDGDAALKAKIAMRDRLQTLLETHQGSISALVDVQKALAEAQADVDATRSELSVSQGRVAMSAVSVDYAVGGQFVSEKIWSPVGDAFQSSLSTVAGSFAALLTLAAILAPWAVCLLAGLLAFRIMRRGTARMIAGKVRLRAP